jgi:hypothetical protein
MSRLVAIAAAIAQPTIIRAFSVWRIAPEQFPN